MFGDPPDPPDGNHLLHYLLGAQIVFTEREQVQQKLKKSSQRRKPLGRKPYLIPYGGSNPTGAMGYVNAMLELAEQDVAPDWIVFPSSSGGTQAGMLVGARLSGFAGKILGISVDEPADRAETARGGTGNSVQQRTLGRTGGFRRKMCW